MEREIQYACEDCGEWFEKSGACPKCGGKLAKVCAECGNPLKECECD